MKRHIQIKNSYNIWLPSTMRRVIQIQAHHNGMSNVIVRNAHIIEWWLHNIGYYLTLPHITAPKIKDLNNRFKHVDLMVEVTDEQR